MLVAIALSVPLAFLDSPFVVVRRAVPNSAFPILAAALGDLDGDGDVDAFLAGTASNALLLNDGTGRFVEGPSAPPAVGGFTQRWLVLAELDGAPGLDVVLTGPFAGAIYLNDGSGSFSDGTAGFGGTLAYEVVAGDVDGDTDVDLWLLKPGGQELFLNDGSGNFTDASVQLPATAVPTSVDLGDIDGDTDLDALVAVDCSGGGSTITLFVNDGSGVFSDASGQLGLVGDSVAAGRLVDVDGDTDLDAILETQACATGSRSSLVLRNDGSGTFSPVAGALAGAPSLAFPFALGDADDDGDVDLWIGVNQHQFPVHLFPVAGEQSRLFLNDGSGVFADASALLPQVDDAPYAGLFVDLDGDGDDDLWVRYGFTATILLSDGTGNLANSSGEHQASAFPTGGVAVGDANGDGHLDLVVVRTDRTLDSEDLRIGHSLYLGDGRGDFSEAFGALPARQWDATGATFGDVDGDGDEDLVVTHLVDDCFLLDPDPLQEAQLWLNDGTGAYTDAPSQLPEFPFVDRGHTLYAVLGDLDGDADLDLVLADADDYDGGKSGILVYLNDGAGTFSDGTAASGLPGVFDPLGLELVDVDGDADLDLLYDAWILGPQLFINDGSAAFTDESATRVPVLAPPPIFSGTFACGDLEGDGDVDLAVLADGDLYVLQNDGNGFFTVVAGPTPFGRPSHAIDLVDIDDDGDLDLLSTTSILENDGTGTLSDTGLGFSESTSWLADYEGVFQYPVRPAVADIDRDGDADLVTPDGVLSTNLTRQVHWRSFPRLGQPLSIDMNGPPGGVALLFAATAILPTPLATTFGNGYLVGPSIFLVRARLFDADGEASLDIALVPDDPDLAGAIVHWQALVDPPTRYTNFETTVLSTF